MKIRIGQNQTRQYIFFCQGDVLDTKYNVLKQRSKPSVYWVRRVVATSSLSSPWLSSFWALRTREENGLWLRAVVFKSEKNNWAYDDHNL